MMGLGQNVFSWFQTEMQHWYWIGLMAAGAYFLIKRNFQSLIWLAIGGIVAGLFIFDPMGVGNWFTGIGQQSIGQ